MKFPPIKKILLCVLIFSLGIAMGLLSWRYIMLKKERTCVYGLHRINSGNDIYPLVNPIIGFDVNESKKERYLELKEKISFYIKNQKKDEAVQMISFYFRNLQSGQWVGINENEEFNPASLLKVPIMMLYFKFAETDPKILEQKLKFTDEDLAKLNGNARTDLETTLQKNVFYSVDELIREMIVHSDNIARTLLSSNITKDPIREIFTDFGIKIQNSNYQISAKNYSLLFRTLYNATFLNRAMSQKALELLTEVDYANGLRADLPSSVKIAQKFGRYFETDAFGKFKFGEIHDCGIVYYSLEQPYLLCVMTRGVTEESKLESIIKDISKLTYEFIEKNPELINAD